MSILTSLTLTNFRNYRVLNLSFEPGLVTIHGHNGAGKTNLLEAISLLAPGRGLRGARLNEIAANGGGSATEITNCNHGNSFVYQQWDGTYDDLSFKY